MKYFVIAPDGSRYGPADEDTLTQWAAENRLTPTSMLESESTGARVMASQVPGIIFSVRPGETQVAPPAPGGPAGYSPYGTPSAPTGGGEWSTPPGQSPYPRGQAYSAPETRGGNNDFVLSWVFFGVTFVACCPILPGLGMYFAKRAIDAKYPGAELSRTLNLVLLILTLLLYVGYAIFFVVMFSMGGGS